MSIPTGMRHQARLAQAQFLCSHTHGAVPTCQWLLLPHVPHSDPLPHATGQDAICRWVELQHVHWAPARTQRQPCTAGQLLPFLRQAPNLHLRHQKTRSDPGGPSHLNPSPPTLQQGPGTGWGKPHGAAPSTHRFISRARGQQEWVKG